MSVALITGGSAGLGLALLEALTEQGWTVVTDGRDTDRLAASGAAASSPWPETSSTRRTAPSWWTRSERLGRLDLLVHNASTLGPLPLPPLRELGLDGLRATWEVNAGAPYELTRALLPWLRATNPGVLISVSSDAAVEHYPTWGAYGAAKAALDHLTATWAVEEGLLAYAHRSR